MKRARIAIATIGLVAVWIANAPARPARADGSKPPTPSPTSPAKATVPAMSPDLARRVQELTEVVLSNHIDPPARQQMILSGIKALYRAAGAPAPPELGRRVSSIATPEQLASLLRESWPRTTVKPIAADKLEEALLEGLLAAVVGGTDLMTARESKVAESFAGNRYVGVHIALRWDEKTKRPVIHDVFPGGPADRAGIKKEDVLEEVEGVATEGMPLREVVDRLRGDEGTDVTVKVRTPKETKPRTMKLTRGQLPRVTVGTTRESASGHATFRLEGPDPIGYLKVREISASTPHELRKLERRLESEGTRALVLDLRGVDGGRSTTIVHSAVLLADVLLEGGPIGRVRTPRGETTYQADPDALFRGWPIAVLVDRNTSGTAEWIAAALQDNHRAVVVGSPSRGAIRRGPSGVLPRVEPANDLPHPFEATVRSTVPVGDGRWSVTLLTGYLVRGDGRPLLDPDAAVLAASRGAEMPDGGVQPDHPIAEAPGSVDRSRKVDQKTYAAVEPDQTPQTTPGDPALDAAVTILRKAMEKR